MKLDICGGEAPYGHGFLNVDIRRLSSVDLVADARLLPIRTGSVEEIFSCGTLEHFNLSDAGKVLAEMHRVLRPGAKLVIGIPDLEAICRAYASGDMDFYLVNQYLYGAQTNPHDLHRSAFNFAKLKELLQAVGFVDIERHTYDLPFHKREYMLKIVCFKADHSKYTSQRPDSRAGEGQEVRSRESSAVHEGLRSDAVPDLSAERVVPTIPAHSTSFQEHMTRYIFAAEFVKGGVILDAGCGTGYGAAYLASRGAATVYGIDTATEAIEYSRVHYQRDNVIFSVMDCTNLDFPDETFDVVVSLEVIEHLGDAERYLSEMRRVLKTNGVFILSTPNKAVHSPNSNKPLNPFHFKEYTVAELEETLSAHFPVVVLFGQRNVGAISIWRLPSELMSHGEVAPHVPCEAIRAIPCRSSTWTHVKDWKSIDSTIATSQIDPSYILAVCAGRDSPRLRGQDHTYLFLPSSPLEDLLRQREEWIEWLQEGIQYRDARIETLETTLDRIHRSLPYRVYQIAKRMLGMN